MKQIPSHNIRLNLSKSLAFLLESDRLKSVKRRVYISDCSRQENSAEHSWHLALALWTLSSYAPSSLNLDHAIKLALIHDLGEIDPGDISIFSNERDQKQQQEQHCIERLGGLLPEKQSELLALWREYEKGESLESQWVKIADRLLPFILNLNSEGKAWKEQNVSRSQVIAINQMSKEHFPELYSWLIQEIDQATQQGWLINL